MKTDNLIDALVADRPPRGRPLRWALAAALLAGGLVSLVLFLAALGVRADIGPALGTWRFELKVGLVLLALGLAFSLCIALSRPVAPPHPGRRLLPLAALAVLAVAIELLALPSASWASRLVGSNALVCLIAIPTLAIVPLAAVLAILRAALPPRPPSPAARRDCWPQRPPRRSMPSTASTIRRCSSSPGTRSPLCLSSPLGAAAGHRLLRW